MLVLLICSLATLGVSCADGPPPIRRSSDPVPTAAPATSTTNDFFPAERNLSDCSPAVERPGCGSTAKGGWRMTLVFIVLLAGIAVIIGRIAVATVRRGRAVNQPKGDWA